LSEVTEPSRLDGAVAQLMAYRAAMSTVVVRFGWEGRPDVYLVAHLCQDVKPLKLGWRSLGMEVTGINGFTLTDRSGDFQITCADYTFGTEDLWREFLHGN
jgi:hypothetical protein